MQTKQQPGSLLYEGVCLCISVCVCNHVIYMKHEWQRWSVSQGRPSYSSAFEIPQKHPDHTCTLCNTKAYRSTLRIRILICSFSFIPSKLTTARAVLDKLHRAAFFIQGQICLCHPFESLFWISVSLLNSWAMNKDFVCFCKALLHSLYSHYHPEPEFISRIQTVTLDLLWKLCLL